jgi:hypothetical protein
LQNADNLLPVFEMSMEHEDTFDILVIIEHMVVGREGIVEDIRCNLLLA